MHPGVPAELEPLAAEYDRSFEVRKLEEPTGIATEADVLHAGYVTDAPLSEIPLRKAMSSPLATIQPKKTLRTATDRMRSESVKKLVVTEEMRPVGIVTTQDITDNYGQIRREVRDLAADAANWSSRSDRP